MRKGLISAESIGKLRPVLISILHLSKEGKSAEYVIFMPFCLSRYCACARVRVPSPCDNINSMKEAFSSKAVVWCRESSINGIVCIRTTSRWKAM
eukprot:1156488-Amphidinium_carterae.1